MVAVANTKMMVRPASRMLSAISLGVFCRVAPSTSAIMRSRKVEPWAAVMRTRITSDSTRVPPVTAERSPPLSRMTGALSPVMALSSTEAMPCTTSPSLGIRSPACTSTTSSTRSSEAGMSCVSSPAPVRRRAMVSVRARRRVAACALPRPSATASARLANSTVIHSQMMICRVKPRFGPPVTRSRRNSSVVSAATTSTTNITGLRIISLGSSLRSVSPSAGTRMAGSNMAAAAPRLLVVAACCLTLVSMGVSWVRTWCRRSSPAARRPARGPGPGRR